MRLLSGSLFGFGREWLISPGFDLFFFWPSLSLTHSRNSTTTLCLLLFFFITYALGSGLFMGFMEMLGTTEQVIEGTRDACMVQGK